MAGFLADALVLFVSYTRALIGQGPVLNGGGYGAAGATATAAGSDLNERNLVLDLDVVVSALVAISSLAIHPRNRIPLGGRCEVSPSIECVTP